MYAVMHYDCEVERESFIDLNIYPNEFDADDMAQMFALQESAEPTELRPFETIDGDKQTGYFVFEMDGRPTGCYFVRELHVVVPEFTREIA